MSLVRLLLDHPTAPNDPIIHTLSEATTRRELEADAERIAEQFRQCGLVAGTAVVARLANGPQLIATMFGTWMVGAVFCAVNPRATATELSAIVSSVRPAVMVDGEATVVCDDAMAYHQNAAFIVWTSGTTGAPRPVQHTHDGYLEFLDRVLRPLRVQSAPKAPMPNLIPVPLALNAGFYNALFGLRAGAALVMMDRFSTADFVVLVRNFAIRSVVLPPAAIAMLTDDAALTELSPLKYVRSITAPLSAMQARRFTKKFGVFVLNGYGQAEIGEVIGWTAADARQYPDKIGAVGRPHDGVVIKVDERGHLWVRPPNAALGMDERLDAQGYIDTGDLAQIDDDGFVWIEGRATDVINRGGNKIVPAAVEEVLILLDSVDEAAVVGVADDRLGEVPVAFLVGRTVPDDVLVAACREHLAAYKVPVAFHWVAELPRNEIGKVLRGELAALVGVPAPTSRASQSDR